MTGQNGSKVRVAMMVWNTCENDSRVIKEATTLVSAGYDVSVVCLAADHLPDLETRDGVTYRRVIRVLNPVRERVDSVLNGFAFIVALMLAGVAAATLTAAVLAAGWWLSTQQVGPALQIAALLTAFALGVAAGTHLRGPRQFVRRGRRWLIKTRRVVARTVLGPIRTKLLWGMYRALTFRLVHFAMAETVTSIKPSVIHAHDLQTLPAASRLAKDLQAFLIYDSHELALNVSNPPMRPLRWWMKHVERRTIRRADGVITVSEGIADALARRYRVPRPVLVYNAPPTASPASVTGDVRTDVGVPGTTPLAIYVGAPSFHRGLEVLIDSMALLPDFELACVGPRNADWEETLLQRAFAAGCGSRVRFLEPVPVTHLLQYLSTADVGVIAYQNICLNHEFCMPNKLFETVLAGVPVVVGNLRDLKSFVEMHQVGRSADETDPRALAEAMREVANDPLLKPSGARLQQLREEYGWEAQGRRLAALYRELDLSDEMTRERTAPAAP